MQRITLHTPVDEERFKLPVGTYLMTEPMAEAVLVERLGSVEPLGCHSGPIDEATFRYEGSLILMTPGAYGDLLFLTPILAAIQLRWPHKDLFVSCFPEYRDALKGVASYVGYLTFPLSATDVTEDDRVIEIIGAITLRPTMHAVDAQAEAIGYRWREGDSKACIYEVTRRETTAASID